MDHIQGFPIDVVEEFGLDESQEQPLVPSRPAAAVPEASVVLSNSIANPNLVCTLNHIKDTLENWISRLTLSGDSIANDENVASIPDNTSSISSASVAVVASGVPSAPESNVISFDNVTNDNGALKLFDCINTTKVFNCNTIYRGSSKTITINLDVGTDIPNHVAREYLPVSYSRLRKLPTIRHVPLIVYQLVALKELDRPGIDNIDKINIINNIVNMTFRTPQTRKKHNRGGSVRFGDKIKGYPESLEDFLKEFDKWLEDNKHMKYIHEIVKSVGKYQKEQVLWCLKNWQLVDKKWAAEHKNKHYAEWLLEQLRENKSCKKNCQFCKNGKFKGGINLEPDHENEEDQEAKRRYWNKSRTTNQPTRMVEPSQYNKEQFDNQERHLAPPCRAQHRIKTFTEIINGRDSSRQKMLQYELLMELLFYVHGAEDFITRDKVTRRTFVAYDTQHSTAQSNVKYNSVIYPTRKLIGLAAVYQTSWESYKEFRDVAFREVLVIILTNTMAHNLIDWCNHPNRVQYFIKRGMPRFPFKKEKQPDGSIILVPTSDEPLLPPAKKTTFVTTTQLDGTTASLPITTTIPQKVRQGIIDKLEQETRRVEEKKRLEKKRKQQEEEEEKKRRKHLETYGTFSCYWSNDILPSNNIQWPGNIHFQRIIDGLKPIYQSKQSQEQSAIIDMVLSTLKSQGRRFITQVGHAWTELDDDAAKERCIQALNG